MEFGKFEPKRALQGLRDEIDTLFDRFVERPLSAITGQMIPPLDVSETANEIFVNIDLPGMDEKDIDISLNNDILTVRGERKKPQEQPGMTPCITERTFGGFSRTVRLPVAVCVEMMKAVYKRGTLEIVLPKKELSHARKIEVQIESDES